MEQIARRLTQAMEIREISAAELARKTGISKSSISRYMSGAYNPNSVKLAKFSEALHVNEAWLLGYDDVEMERESDEERAAHALTVEQQLSETMLAKVIELFHTLDLNQQVHLFEVIRKEEQKLEATK